MYQAVPGIGDYALRVAPDGREYKGKMQKAKGSTEEIPLRRQGVATGMARNIGRGQGRKSRMSSLLTFDLCISHFDFFLFAFRRLAAARYRLLAAYCLPLTAFFLLPAILDAQGCAMCYTSASAAKAGAKEALANGTMILLVPPMVFFALITVVIYKYRNRYRETLSVPGHLSSGPGAWSARPERVSRFMQGMRLVGKYALLHKYEGQAAGDK